MDWNEILVKTWQEFIDALEPVLDAYKGHVPPVYVFRGQANASWLLEPSLLRQLRSVRDPVAARKVEELLETEFTAQAALFPETSTVWLALLSAQKTELWAYMQHHGCSTRLLDGPILGACESIAADRPGYVIHRKIVIAAELKLVILQQLRAMNTAPHGSFLLSMA